MKTVLKLVRSLVMLGTLCTFQSAPSARAFEDLGTVPVSTISHQYVPVDPQAGIYLVRDFLVRQALGINPVSPVSFNFDATNEFSLTLSAPSGQRFFVDVPDGQQVIFNGSILWDANGNGADGDPHFGFVNVSFTGLEGTAPLFPDASALLTENHTRFGFSDLQSALFTGDFYFSSITFSGSVPDEVTGSGQLDYLPIDFDALFLEYTLFAAPNSNPPDPGSFVFIVPEPSTFVLLAAASLCVVVVRRRKGA